MHPSSGLAEVRFLPLLPFVRNVRKYGLFGVSILSLLTITMNVLSRMRTR